MKILDKEFLIFIYSQDIRKKVSEMAAAISADYVGRDPLFIILLNGAFAFATDLIREINFPCQLSFVKITSYIGTASSGVAKEIIGLEEIIENRHVIVIDDIVDTGNTMKSVIPMLMARAPASLEIATLLMKPDVFNNAFLVKYTGFKIPNKFVIGYGLDYNGYGRNLPDIYGIKN